jgi:hypothetical protein
VAFGALVIAVAVVWAALLLSRAGSRVANAIDGFITTPENQPVYMPWDELLKDIIDQDPTKFSEADLELEHTHEAVTDG